MFAYLTFIFHIYFVINHSQVSAGYLKNYFKVYSEPIKLRTVKENRQQ